MTRMHKLYRHSCTTGKCEDCGLIDNHSNACHEAAPIRKIEELYDQLDAANLKVAALKKALERIAAMDAVTDAEREHYWTDRAESMRDTAMIALGGEPVPPLSQLLETARRGLSYIQYGAKDLEDARRAAEHALNWMPSPGENRIDRYRKALEYIAEGGKLSPMEVARRALPKKCACDGYGKVVGGDGNFYTCPNCGGTGHAHDATAKPKCEHRRWVKTAVDESTCLDCKAVFPFKDPTAKPKCECVWLDGGVVGEYRDSKVPCQVHDTKKPHEDPLLKKIDAGIQAIKDMSTNKKASSEWAICGWCAGTGKEYGELCPKCQGAGGKELETDSCESIFPRWNVRCCLPPGHQGRHESKGGAERTLFKWSTDKEICHCGLPITEALHICVGPVKFPEKQVKKDADGRIRHCLGGKEGCTGGAMSCSCTCPNCSAIRNF